MSVIIVHSMGPKRKTQIKAERVASALVVSDFMMIDDERGGGSRRTASGTFHSKNLTHRGDGRWVNNVGGSGARLEGVSRRRRGDPASRSRQRRRRAWLARAGRPPRNGRRGGWQIQQTRARLDVAVRPESYREELDDKIAAARAHFAVRRCKVDIRLTPRVESTLVCFNVSTP